MDKKVWRAAEAGTNDSGDDQKVSVVKSDSNHIYYYIG